MIDQKRDANVPATVLGEDSLQLGYSTRCGDAWGKRRQRWLSELYEQKVGQEAGQSRSSTRLATCEGRRTRNVQMYQDAPDKRDREKTGTG